MDFKVGDRVCYKNGYGLHYVAKRWQGATGVVVGVKNNGRVLQILCDDKDLRPSFPPWWLNLAEHLEKIEDNTPASFGPADDSLTNQNDKPIVLLDQFKYNEAAIKRPTDHIPLGIKVKAPGGIIGIVTKKTFNSIGLSISDKQRITYFPVRMITTVSS